jgi:hypothetical protein
VNPSCYRAAPRRSVSSRTEEPEEWHFLHLLECRLHASFRGSELALGRWFSWLMVLLDGPVDADAAAAADGGRLLSEEDMQRIVEMYDPRRKPIGRANPGLSSNRSFQVGHGPSSPLPCVSTHVLKKTLGRAPSSGQVGVSASEAAHGYGGARLRKASPLRCFLSCPPTDRQTDRQTSYLGAQPGRGVCKCMTGFCGGPLWVGIEQPLSEFSQRSRQLRSHVGDGCVQLKHLNIMDPLLPTNNLGRSVSKSSYVRIRTALAHGARTLTAITQMVRGPSTHPIPAA